VKFRYPGEVLASDHPDASRPAGIPSGFLVCLDHAKRYQSLSIPYRPPSARNAKILNSIYQEAAHVSRAMASPTDQIENGIRN
jgi:hypothetical protein